jgi:hypothetical protein
MKASASITPGARVGARRWPNPLHGGMPPWQGTVLSPEDPLAWRGTVLGARPTAAQVRAHLDWLAETGVPLPEVPVLWAFDEPQVRWEKPESLRPYPVDLQLWRQARALDKTSLSLPHHWRDIAELWFGGNASMGVAPAVPGDLYSPAVFPDGSATDPTGYAQQVKLTVEDILRKKVDVVGFPFEENPDCAVSREQWTADGSYQFALVEGRYLIDPWARNMAGARSQIFYDLRDPDDWDAVLETYGDAVFWRDMSTTAPEPIAA